MSAGAGHGRGGSGWGWGLAAVLWMALIFCGSLAALSGDHTHRLLDWLARRLHRAPSFWEEERINLLLRKAWHLAEYAVLAALLHAALRRVVPDWGGGRGCWHRAGIAAAAFALAVLYGQGDEYHQRFVPGRASSVRDVEIDAAGAALGVAATLAWRARRRSGEQPPE